jgi:hypothetical protein
MFAQQESQRLHESEGERERMKGEGKERERGRGREGEESFSVCLIRSGSSNVSCSAHDWLSSIPVGVAERHDLLTILLS